MEANRDVSTSVLLLLFFIAFILSLQFRDKRSRKAFDTWHKTHFLIVEFLLKNRDNKTGVASDVDNDFGTEGLYNLSKQWSDEFEKENKKVYLHTLDHYDMVLEFCKTKNKE